MDKLQKLIDIEEIKNLKHRYFRAIDMADFDLLDNIFFKRYNHRLSRWYIQMGI
jgi:hypothetical protein